MKITLRHYICSSGYISHQCYHHVISSSSMPVMAQKSVFMKQDDSKPDVATQTCMIYKHLYGMRWGRDRNLEEELKDGEMPMGSRGSIRSSSEQSQTDGGKLAMSAPSVRPRTNILQRSHTKSCFQLERHIACGEQSEGNGKKYKCGRLQAIKKRTPLFLVRRRSPNRALPI